MGKNVKRESLDVKGRGEVPSPAELKKEVRSLRKWVNDLQSGMYINCVYCGHRYGPKDEVPASMADILKEHIQQCPKHPMSALRTTLLNIIGRIEAWQNTDPDLMNEQEVLDSAEETIMEVMTLACDALEEKRGKGMKGLINFAEVVPGVLYRGAQPVMTGFQELIKMGIKTVVNLRSMHDDRDICRLPFFEYYQIPCHAWHPEEEDVKAFLKIMRNPANHPVFVHCQHGADRTGTMVAIYRIVEQGWSYEDAIAELPTYGMHEIWTGIRPFIEKYGREIKQ